MDEGAKRRLVGAAVLVALAVIFVPMLLNDKDDDGLGEPIVIPDAPGFDVGDADADAEAASAASEASVPALPSPEPPTGALSGGRDEQVGMVPLVPDYTAPSATGPSTEPAPSSRDARPAPPAARTAAAAVGPKPVPPGAAAWVVQVASLGSAAAAETLQNDLRGKGYPAFVEQARVNGKLYYRVRVGPETNRARADGVAAQLQRETGTKPLVQTYR